MPNTCIANIASIEHEDGRDKTPAQAVLDIANDLHTLMTLSEFKNITDVVPTYRGEEAIPKDVISLVNDGRITAEDFTKETDPAIITRVMNRLSDLATGLAHANKDFIQFLNRTEIGQDTVNLVRYEAARGRMPLRVYDYFNMHQHLIKDGRFDIHGAYVQIINKMPAIRELDGYMKEMVDRSRTHGTNILNQYQKIIKDHVNEIKKLPKSTKIRGKQFLEETLKFFDPSYGLSLREDWKIRDSNESNRVLIDKFVSFIHEKGFFNFAINEEEFAGLSVNLYRISLSAAKAMWRLNYGDELAEKMMSGEFNDKQILWEDVPNDQDTILGLQKAHIEKISRMWDIAAPIMNDDHRRPFERLLAKFNLGNDENGNAVTPIRTFYLPYIMSEKQRAAFEPQLIRETEDSFDNAVLKFIGERKTSDDSRDPTDNMTAAMFQRIEQLMFGVNTVTHKMFARAANDFASDDKRDLHYAMRRALKAYASNVEIAGSPARRGSVGVERFKQIMRLSAIFPAFMISKAASGVRNLVGAGMGLYNADWHSYAMNSDFKKALAKTDTEKSGEGYLAKRIDTMVDSGYISPGLASAFLDSSKFIEILSARENMSQATVVDKVLTGIESTLMKAADWTVNGFFLRNLDWYRNTFTVPGSERTLRSKVKNMIFQTANADLSMMMSLRSSNTEDIKLDVGRYLEADTDSARQSIGNEIINLAQRQLNIATKQGNQEMRRQYSALLSAVKKGSVDREDFSAFLNYKAVLSDKEIDDIIDISARYWKSHIDEQLGDFSPAGKPYIENLMLKDADTYWKVMVGGILKAASYFNVVGRTTSMAYLQGGHLTIGTMLGKTGKEAAGWESGVKGMTNFEYGGAATVSVGLGTMMILYGMLAGLFKKNVMIGSALSMNPMSNYVPPARLIGVEAFTLFGVISGLGGDVPEYIRDQVYKDNIRWFTGAIAGKSAAQLWEETQVNGRSVNPINYINEMAMDLMDLPDLVSHGLRNIRMEGDFEQYYDWRREFNNVLNPINHLAPVYLAQKTFETVVDISAPKDERGTRILATNIRNTISNWVGATVWTQVNEDVIKRPAFRRQRWETKADSVEEVMRLEKYSTSATRPQQQALANLHRRLRRYGAQSR